MPPFPLHPGRYWLDWDTAISILGHDGEIKETYESLLNSSEFRPDVFIDIGGNYGTHSLLFLIHGVETITFEPNQSCNSYFAHLCSANSVSSRIEAVALGDEPGQITLAFPERETWLGSVQPEVAARIANRSELVREEVEIRTLDSFTVDCEAKRVLIKIDTEGSEMSVLRGAVETMRRFRPIILFEVLSPSDRDEVALFLEAADYRIVQLPWTPPQKPVFLDKDQFLCAYGTNFAALSGEFVS